MGTAATTSRGTTLESFWHELSRHGVRRLQGSTDQVHRRPGVRSLSEIGAGLHVPLHCQEERAKGLGHVDSARRDGEITEWRSTTKSTASGALRQPRRVDHWAELNRLNGLGRHHNNNWRGSIHKHFHTILDNGVHSTRDAATTTGLATRGLWRAFAPARSLSESAHRQRVAAFSGPAARSRAWLHRSHAGLNVKRAGRKQRVLWRLG